MIRRFNRFELKYVLPLSRCAAIIGDLEKHVRPDRHGGSDGYPVVSLYYDSPDLECFWSKIEGLKFRRKVRLRAYPGPEGISSVTSASLEIKQRINRTVQKRRLELPLTEAEALCAGNVSDERLESLDALDRQVAEEVLFLQKSLSLRPAAITAYHRRAFEGELENAGLRVTFDTQVSGRMHALRLNTPAANRLILPPDWSVVEVKANDAVPDWVTSLLARHDCQLQRISKYCAVVSQLNNMDVLPLAISPNIPVAHAPTTSERPPSEQPPSDPTGSERPAVEQPPASRSASHG